MEFQLRYEGDVTTWLTMAVYALSGIRSGGVRSYNRTGTRFCSVTDDWWCWQHWAEVEWMRTVWIMSPCLKRHGRTCMSSMGQLNIDETHYPCRNTKIMNIGNWNNIEMINDEDVEPTDDFCDLCSLIAEAVTWRKRCSLLGRCLGDWRRWNVSNKRSVRSKFHLQEVILLSCLYLS